MTSTQDNWRKHFKDKQWHETKGWCDLNGNPYNFRKRNAFRKSNYTPPTNHVNKDKYYNEDGSVYSYRDKHTHLKNQKRVAVKPDNRLSLIKTILKTILYQFISLLITEGCLMIFFENTHIAIICIFFITFCFLAFRCVWLILKNLFKWNIKIW